MSHEEITGMGMGQDQGSGEELSVADAALLRFFFGEGQSVFLRSSHGALERRLERKAYPKDSPERKEGHQRWQAYLREQQKAGVSRAALPWAPQVTAAPTAEVQASPAVEMDDRQKRDWDRIAEASRKLRLVKTVFPQGEDILQAIYGDHSGEWRTAGFPHGALYRYDEAVVEPLGKLKSAENSRVAKLREKRERAAKKRGEVPKVEDLVVRSDLQLMTAERERAEQYGDMDTLRELARIEGTARRLLSRVAGIWNSLGASR